MDFPQSCVEELSSNTTGLEGRIDASVGTESLDPPLQLIRVELQALQIDPDPVEGSDLLCRQGVL